MWSNEVVGKEKKRYPMGNVDARVDIFTATALGRGRVASRPNTLGCLYPGYSV